LDAVQLVYSSPDEYTVFLSSGDDALHLRDLVDDLVRDAVNEELLRAGLPVRLIVSRWERTPPGRAQGESVNDRFVRMAKSSSVTLCLLIKKLGKGTREEMEAVLATDDVDLSVIWFVSRATWPMSSVGKFLREHRDEIFIDRAGVPDSPGAAVAVVRFLLHIVMQHLVQTQGGFRERR
jgi:hypothetical protein